MHAHVRVPVLSFLAIVPLALSAGCSSYTPPSMEVADARVTERTQEGVALAFTIDAANPNDDALPMREATYSLEIEGQRVFTGIRSAEATLRRRGSQQFILPVGIPASALTGLTAGTVRYRISGNVEYVVPGAFAELLFDTGVRRPEASFADEGTIDLAAAPSQPPAANPAPPLPPPREPEPAKPAPPANPGGTTPAPTPPPTPVNGG
jgi:LEA14-like dessication related protein